jgi:glycosyltransferase involved in cell wall biosynthesis
MKLVVLTNILTPYRIPLFEALQRRVSDFTVLIMAQQEENRRWNLKQPDFKTVVLRGLHVRAGRQKPSRHINYGVIRALSKLNPDVVLSGGFAPANFFGWLYCKIYRKKFIGWGELTIKDTTERSVHKRILRWMLTRFSDGSIASSSDARETFLHYGAKGDQILTATLPIDVSYFYKKTTEFRGTPEHKTLRAQYQGPILLSIGQFIRRKGYLEMFRIYERILKTDPNVHLLIVGQGAEQAVYEKEVEQRGLSQIHFLGYIQTETLHKVLAITDCFIFHTLWDPFGVVLSEAMAAELPAVSSIYASATRDLIEEGVTGFRIDPKNTEASALAVLKVLRMTSEERKILGKKAYERVKQCDVEPSADAIIRFLDSVRHPRGHSGSIPEVNSIKRVHEEHS